jgi:hypothetical protein
MNQASASLSASAAFLKFACTAIYGMSAFAFIAVAATEFEDATSPDYGSGLHADLGYGL